MGIVDASSGGAEVLRPEPILDARVHRRTEQSLYARSSDEGVQVCCKTCTRQVNREPLAISAGSVGFDGQETATCTDENDRVMLLIALALLIES